MRLHMIFRFLFVLRTVYNIVVSEGKNDRANTFWDEMQADLPDLAAVDLESIFARLGIIRNVRLCTFLRKITESDEGSRS